MGNDGIGKTLDDEALAAATAAREADKLPRADAVGCMAGAANGAGRPAHAPKAVLGNEGDDEEDEDDEDDEENDEADADEGGKAGADAFVGLKIVNVDPFSPRMSQEVLTI